MGFLYLSQQVSFKMFLFNGPYFWNAIYDQ